MFMALVAVDVVTNLAGGLANTVGFAAGAWVAGVWWASLFAVSLYGVILWVKRRLHWDTLT